MIIFGWGGGTPKDQGPVAPAQCPRCGNTQVFRYVVARKWFRLYFIPLIPYETKHLLVCPVCTSGTRLEKSQVDRVKEMSAITAQYTARALGDQHYTQAVDAFWASRPLPQTPQIAAGTQPDAGSPIVPGPNGAAPPLAPSRPVPPPVAAQPVPAPANAGAVGSPFEGSRFVLRKYADSFVVVRRSDAAIVQTFPGSDEGYGAAWVAFRTMEDSGGEPEAPAAG